MEKDKADIKKKILETSERLFACRGFDGVSIDEIADEAEINKSMIYYYFTNKQCLLFKIIINFILVLGWFESDKEADIIQLKNTYIERVTNIAETLIIPSRPREKDGRR